MDVVGALETPVLLFAIIHSQLHKKEIKIVD